MFAVVERLPSGIEKPPQLVKRDLARLGWAWNGLCLAVPLDEATRLGFRDIANDYTDQVINSAFLTWTRDVRGNPAVSSVVAGGWYLNRPPYQYPSSEVTALVRFRRVDTGFADGGYWHYFTNAANPPWVIYGSSDGLGAMYGGVTISATHTTTATTSVVQTGEYVTAALRWRSGGPLTLDVLGERGNVLSSVASAGSPTGVIDYTDAFAVGFNSNTPNSTAKFSQMLLWSRRLADAEMTLMAMDPFGWYSPRRETVNLSGVLALPGYREPEWTFGKVVQVG